MVCRCLEDHLDLPGLDGNYHILKSLSPSLEPLQRWGTHVFPRGLQPGCLPCRDLHSASPFSPITPALAQTYQSHGTSPPPLTPGSAMTQNAQGEGRHSRNI